VTVRARVTASIALLVAILSVGVVARLWNLRSQVLAGDETHALGVALDPSAPILFTYRVSDNCIPLTLYDRLLVDWGVSLTEILVRMPALVAGFALLILAPLWVWRRSGAGPAVIFGWLLAVSPGLVFYTRIARSYAPITLLGCAAVVAFEAWDRRRGPWLAASYVACAAIAVWFHLVATPLVLAPLGAALVLVAFHRGRGLVSWALLASVTLAGLLMVLVPARATLGPLISGKRGQLDISSPEAVEVATWLAGVRWPLVAAGFWAIVVVGLVRLARRDRRLACFVGAALGGQLVGVLVLAPEGHQGPIILSRYLLAALPFAAVAAAEALGQPWPGRWQRGQAVAVAVSLVGLTAVGPFLDPAIRRSSFAHNEVFLRFTAPRPSLPPGASAPAYRWLASAGPGAVIELPWHNIWPFDRLFALHQTVHRREVVVSAFATPLVAPKVSFHNMTALDADALLACRGRWLVVHLLVVQEELRVGPWPLFPGYRRLFSDAASTEAARLRHAWGPPDFRNHWAMVWDLDRIRRRVASPAAGKIAPGRAQVQDERPTRPRTAQLADRRRPQVLRQPGEEHLGGDGNEDHPHQPLGSDQRAAADARAEPGGERQHQGSGEPGGAQRQQPASPALRLAAHQQQLGGEHRGAGHVGDGERHHEGLAGEVLGMVGRGEDHAQGDEEENDAAGDGERRLRDAEQAQQRRAGEEEGHHHAVGDE
jgi:hypothetical protein